MDFIDIPLSVVEATHTQKKIRRNRTATEALKAVFLSSSTAEKTRLFQPSTN